MLIFDELRLVYTHYYIFMAYQLLHTHTHTHTLTCAYQMANKVTNMHCLHLCYKYRLVSVCVYCTC